jgi:DNA invertase Pin-like site-specific DNA recombinase
MYSRVSTDKQVTHGTSLIVQLEMMTSYCQQAQLTVLRHFKDEGQSGSEWLRPSFQAMLKFVDNQQIKHIVVYSLDRLSRSYFHLAKIGEVFKNKKIAIHTIYGPIKIWETSGFLLYVFSSFQAEAQVIQIRENTQRSLDHKKSEALLVGSVPYGYEVREFEGKKHLHKYLPEQRAIEKANIYYKLGHSLTEVARMLLHDGFRNRKGFRFDTTQVRRMLYPGVWQKTRETYHFSQKYKDNNYDS